MVEYPSNSHKINEPPKEHRSDRLRNLKVVKGTTTRRKKPLGARFLSMFLSGESFKSAALQVGLGSLIPAGKQLLLSAAKELLDRMVNGDDGVRSSSSSSTGNISYNRMGSSSGGRDHEFGRRDRAVHNLDRIEFEHEEDAAETIDFLYNAIQADGEVRLSEFYAMAGLSCEPQDENWGWKDLWNVKVFRNRNGTWRIQGLPRPIPIRNR